MPGAPHRLYDVFRKLHVAEDISEVTKMLILNLLHTKRVPRRFFPPCCAQFTLPGRFSATMATLPVGKTQLDRGMIQNYKIKVTDGFGQSKCEATSYVVCRIWCATPPPLLQCSCGLKQ